MSSDLVKAHTDDLMQEIERRFMALPDGFSLAVSGGQMVRDGQTLNYSVNYDFAELEPGVRTGPHAGEWTVYGPMTAELRKRMMGRGLPR